MRHEHIYELLREHSRVIIPNFGAFLLKEKPKNVDGTTTMVITFNDFLKFNDGLLIDHVAQRNNIDKLQAEQQIKEFISRVQYQLINQGEYQIEGIGILYKDEKGSLKFRQEEVRPTKPVSEAPPKSPPTENVKTESKTGLKPLAVNEEKKFTGSPAAASSKPLSKPVERPTVKAEPIRKTAKPPTPPVKMTPKKEKKQLLPVWRYILVVISAVAVVLIVLYLMGYFDRGETRIPDSTVTQGMEQESGTMVENNQTEVEPMTIDDDSGEEPETGEDIMEDQSEEMTEDPVGVDNDPEPYLDNESTTMEEKEMDEDVSPVQELPSSPAVVSKPYHIIAASFQDKANAYDYVLKLRQQGYDSKIVNNHNGFYRVCYYSYETKSKALSELQNIVTSVNANAWYLYYR